MKDNRNTAPMIREAETTPRPFASIVHGISRPEIPTLAFIHPRPYLHDFRAVQPFKFVLYGEKSSLEEILGPIASFFIADLYLPAGELSDTMLYQMARAGAEDGRKMIVFTITDCDPSGWQMAISASRKLQAFKAVEFPDLEFEVHPVALTPEQVKMYELPSDPLRPTERRKDKWFRAMGVEQTEIDALIELHPDELSRLVRDAIHPFYDGDLGHRVAEAEREWRQRAEAAVNEYLDPELLDQVRAEAEEKAEEFTAALDALNNRLEEEVEGVELPERPDLLRPRLIFRRPPKG